MYGSPPLELNPVPTKRTKFRDILTPNGQLIENEEATGTIAERNRAERSVELLDLSSDRIEFGSRIFFTSKKPNISEQVDFDEFPGITLTNTNTLHDKFSDSAVTSDLFDFQTAESPATNNTSYTELTPSDHSFSTAPTPPTLRSLGDRAHLEFQLKAKHVEHVAVPVPSSLEPKIETHCLLDIDVNFDNSPSGEQEDLTSLNINSQSLEDLIGLNFEESAVPVTLSNRNVSGRDEPALEDLFTEAIVFQDRRSRLQTFDSKIKTLATPVDPDLADRAFRVFSQGIRSQKA